MTLILWCVLIAALLHVLCAGIAKFSGKGYDNRHPRQWFAGLDGFRARANAAQANTLEGLPFFFAAVLLALHNDAPLQRLQGLMIAWLVARVAYIWFYVRDRATLRSIVWAVALAINIAILFAAAY